MSGERLPLGFTFSFPLKQEALTTGLLVQWTKGFNCDGVVGKDVVILLQEALGRRNVSNVTGYKHDFLENQSRKRNVLIGMTG